MIFGYPGTVKVENGNLDGDYYKWEWQPEINGSRNMLILLDKNKNVRRRWEILKFDGETFILTDYFKDWRNTKNGGVSHYDYTRMYRRMSEIVNDADDSSEREFNSSITIIINYKMKKFFVYLMGVFMMLGSVMMTSCGGDDKDSISGVYACEINYGMQKGTFAACYSFTSGNTVIYYSIAHKGNYIANNKGEMSFTHKIGSSDWYHSDEGPGVSYTYVFEDNKIIIPMQGVILTKSGNSLHQDGSLKVFTK